MQNEKPAPANNFPQTVYWDVFALNVLIHTMRNIFSLQWPTRLYNVPPVHGSPIHFLWEEAVVRRPHVKTAPWNYGKGKDQKFNAHADLHRNSTKLTSAASMCYSHAISFTSLVHDQKKKKWKWRQKLYHDKTTIERQLVYCRTQPKECELQRLKSA